MRSFLFSALLAVVATEYTEANATASGIDDLFYGDSLGVMCGVDWRGNDIAGIPRPVPDRCNWSCLGKYDTSAVYAWTNYQGGTCWCKSDRIDHKGLMNDKLSPNAGAITYAIFAFIKFDPPARVVAMYEKSDMPGYDIGNFPTPNLQLCIDTCEKAAGCFAFTLTAYNGGTCWLKGRASALVPVDYGISGVVMRKHEKQCHPL